METFLNISNTAPELDCQLTVSRFDEGGKSEKNP